MYKRVQPPTKSRYVGISMIADLPLDYLSYLCFYFFLWFLMTFCIFSHVPYYLLMVIVSMANNIFSILFSVLLVWEYVYSKLVLTSGNSNEPFY